MVAIDSTPALRCDPDPLLAASTVVLPSVIRIVRDSRRPLGCARPRPGARTDFVYQLDFHLRLEGWGCNGYYVHYARAGTGVVAQNGIDEDTADHRSSSLRGHPSRTRSSQLPPTHHSQCTRSHLAASHSTHTLTRVPKGDEASPYISCGFAYYKRAGLHPRHPAKTPAGSYLRRIITDESPTVNGRRMSSTKSRSIHSRAQRLPVRMNASSHSKFTRRSLRHPRALIQRQPPPTAQPLTLTLQRGSRLARTLFHSPLTAPCTYT